MEPFAFIVHRDLRVFLFIPFFLLNPSVATSSPVVLELFSSQGCSSCPPAEKVMDRLRATYGTTVIALVCHVDYWDNLGWKDPYSREACTERQHTIARTAGRGTVYTPQLLINGEKEINGADESSARSEIELQRVRKLLSVPIEKRVEGTERILQFRLPQALTGRKVSVLAYLFQDQPSVAVIAGENHGRTMGGLHTVTSLSSLEVEEDGFFRYRVEPSGSIILSKAGLAILIEDSSHKILGSGRVFPLQ